MTKHDSTRMYRTLKNCVILYDIKQDQARPYRPYKTKEDYTRSCRTTQNQRGQYDNTVNFILLRPYDTILSTVKQKTK